MSPITALKKSVDVCPRIRGSLAHPYSGSCSTNMRDLLGQWLRLLIQSICQAFNLLGESGIPGERWMVRSGGGSVIEVIREDLPTLPTPHWAWFADIGSNGPCWSGDLWYRVAHNALVPPSPGAGVSCGRPVANCLQLFLILVDEFGSEPDDWPTATRVRTVAGSHLLRPERDRAEDGRFCRAGADGRAAGAPIEKAFAQ